MKKLLLIISLLALSVVPAFAQTSLVKPAAPAGSPKPDNKSAHSSSTAAPKSGIDLPPEKKNPVNLPKFEKAPVIDGKLDDEVWKSAVVLKDFYQVQPGDNIAPSKPTEVFIGYDSKNLYFGFHCYDDERDKVRATVAKRDEVFGDDNVRVFLDTFNDQRRAYVLG